MIYGSVCSGVEAATVAWHPLRLAFRNIVLTAGWHVLCSKSDNRVG